MIVIDGHNLIPKIKGWSLSDLDDEAALIEVLIRYTKTRREPVEVFFDGAPPGQARQQRYGRLTAHFVSIGTTADNAIRWFLVSLGNQARNATVVSSDRVVQANARTLRAQVMRSEVFAPQLLALLPSENGPAPGGSAARGPAASSPKSAGAQAAKKPASAPGKKTAPGAGLEEWLDVFGIAPDEAEKPIELGIKPKKNKKPGRGPEPRGGQPRKKG